jgi:ribosomal protein S18 acetylase RimI-like enzyme
MPSDQSIRPATRQDRSLIASLLKYETMSHCHLDWRTPLDWLGSQPFWLIERNQRPLAALACPPDPPEIAWVRFFACTSALEPEMAWNLLFDKVKADLANSNGVELAGLALHAWFAHLLRAQGFHHHQDIVVLTWDSTPPKPFFAPPGVIIRRLEPHDLPIVQTLDQLAFERLWQVSHATLARAYQQSAYATVAEVEGEIVGYQICTATDINAHLARLAVDPNRQRAGIGAALVHDIQVHFHRQRLRYVTVNTQSDNHASLSLYERLGFFRSGDRFPVYYLHNPR